MTNNDLRALAAAKISKCIEGVPVPEVAQKLGVSRQTIYNLKNGRFCPSLALVQRACELWDLDFEFRGLHVNAAAFASPKSEPVLSGQQMDLFVDTLVEKLKNRSFEVAAKPMGTAGVELTLRLVINA